MWGEFLFDKPDGQAGSDDRKQITVQKATALQNTENTPIDLGELPVGDRVSSGSKDVPDLTIVPPGENQPRNSIAIQKRPSYLILADSHLKHLPERLRQPNYDVDFKIVRGAEWINQYAPKLSIQSIISLREIIEAVSSSVGIEFVIGTSTLRHTPFHEAIEQAKYIITVLHSYHPQLLSSQYLHNPLLPLFSRI
ncbi:unnamed protein product [Didymodactylos carnosus]|uniref:Uncharacterized protein n=1 Tax=Didymodactylos carnosus TaxID=1234261 RepID=A0A8S2KUK8_9BILA|nr:unnamed protein product [Didymodactylos carnosus]CAF3860709.1 unnamed protein product [Didymodactylos carnosus]